MLIIYVMHPYPSSFFLIITKEQIYHSVSYPAQNCGSSSKFSPPLESCVLSHSFVYMKLHLAEISSPTETSCYVTVRIKADMSKVKLQVNHCTNCLSGFQHFHGALMLWDTTYDVQQLCNSSSEKKPTYL